MSRAAPSVRDARRRGQWTSARALVAHGSLAVWVPGCVVACWWQVGVAESGDSLGWVYSVMWPCFALFGTVFWWHFVHDDPETLGRRGLRRLQRERRLGVGTDDAGVGAPGADGELTDPDIAAIKAAEADDPELAAYNDYLAALAQNRPRSWRR